MSVRRDYPCTHDYLFSLKCLTFIFLVSALSLYDLHIFILNPHLNGLFIPFPPLPFLLLAVHFHLKYMLQAPFGFLPLLSYTLLLGGSFWIGCLIAFTPLLTTCSGFHVTVVTSPSQQYTCSTSLSAVHFCWHTFALQSCPFQLWCHLRIKSENLKHSLHVMNQSVSCAFRAILVMYLPWENWECSHSNHFFEGLLLSQIPIEKAALNNYSLVLGPLVLSVPFISSIIL